MNYGMDRAWMEVSLDSIKENFYKIGEAIGNDKTIIAVVKADAYGLGAVPISKMLEEIGCKMFAVACIEEAMELREAGVTAEILLLGPVDPCHVALVAKENITVPVVSLSSAKSLSKAAKAAGVDVNIHIKTDAGLARFGLMLSDMNKALEETREIFTLEGLAVKGIFTHYTATDIPLGDEFNKAQINLFDSYCKQLYKEGYSFLKHSASSFFTHIYPECHNDAVRVAALLLGLEAPAIRGVVATYSVSLKTKIYQIKDLPMGAPIGYGPWFYTLRKTKIAVIPLGYADGIRRTIQGKASYMIRGKWAPIIGKISMDYTMLDVTDIDGVSEGDTVTVIGKDGSLHQEAYELANIYPGTVGEVTSVIPARIPRFYIQNGELLNI